MLEGRTAAKGHGPDVDKSGKWRRGKRGPQVRGSAGEGLWRGQGFTDPRGSTGLGAGGLVCRIMGQEQGLITGRENVGWALGFGLDLFFFFQLKQNVPVKGSGTFPDNQCHLVALYPTVRDNLAGRAQV